MSRKEILTKWLLCGLLLCTITLGTRAQEQDEYKMEIGAGLAFTAYWGDFNGNVLKGFQPGATALVKRTFNPYSAVAFHLLKGKLKGSSEGLNTYYATYVETPYRFDAHLLDAAFTYEYNFFPYGTGKEYRGAKRITPYISGGFGLTTVWGGISSVTTVNIPLGIGVKYKLADRLNIAAEYNVRLTMSDKLDGVKDPYGITSSGLFKNTDGYSMFRITLSYSFMAKCKTCHNDND